MKIKAQKVHKTQLIFAGFLCLLIIFLSTTAWAGWHNPSWNYRKQITIDPSMTPNTDRSWFPALIYELTDAQLAASACTNGEDILFTDSTGTNQLDHEIEEFNSIDGKLVAWVEIETLSSSAPTVIYMYYGNGGCVNQENVPGTWDENGANNYHAVYHLNEDPSISTDGDCGGSGKEACDSTSKSNDLDAVGSMQSSDLVTGKIAGAVDFDDNDTMDYLMLPDANLSAGFPGKSVGGYSGPFTLSAWVNVHSLPTSNLREYELINKYASTSGQRSFRLGLEGSSGQPLDVDRPFFGPSAAGGLGTYSHSTTKVTVGSWYYMVGVYDGTDLRMYFNANMEANAKNPRIYSSGINLGTDDFVIGARTNAPARWLDGILDEARVASTNRSADWIQTEYNNQINPAGYLTFAAEKISVSGTCKKSDESTDCTDAGADTIRVAVNGSPQGEIQTTVAGTWTISGVSRPSASDIITVYIEGAANLNEAVAVTKYDGTGNISGVQLIEQHLTIGSNDNQTLSNADLGQYDNSVSTKEDIFHDVVSGDLTVDVTTDLTDEELYIITGNGYTPGGNVSTKHVEILGTVTAGSNTFTVSGDWDSSSGTFTRQTSTVDFTGTGTVKGPGTSLFYNASFAAAGQITTFTSNNDITNNTTLGTGEITGVSSQLNISKSTGQALYTAGATISLPVAYYAGGGGTMGVTGTTYGSTLRIHANAAAKTYELLGDVTCRDLIVSGNGDSRESVLDTQGFALNTSNGSITIGKSGFSAQNGKLIANNSTIDVNGDVVIYDGSGNNLINAGTSTWTVAGNWTNNDTFTAGTSTVTFDAGTTGHTITSGGSSFYDVDFNNASGAWTFQDTFSAANDFNVTDTDTTGNGVDTNNQTVNVTRDLTITAGNFTTGTSTITVGRNWDSSGMENMWGLWGSTVVLTGTGNVRQRTAGGGWNYLFDKISLAAAGQTTTLTSSNLWTSNQMTLGTGTFTDGANSYTVYLQGTGDVLIDAGATITLQTLYYRAHAAGGPLNVVGRDYTGINTLGFYGVGQAAGSNEHIMQGNVIANNIRIWPNNSGGHTSNSVLTTNNYTLTATSLSIGRNTDTNDYALLNAGTSAIDINGSVIIYPSDANGTNEINAGSSSWTVSGNWTNNDTFTPGTSTVQLDGGNQTINGSTTFNNFTKSETSNNASDVTLTFDNTGTQTINGILTLDGLDGDDRINLVSDSPGNHWDIVLGAAATKVIDYVDVSWSDASGSNIFKLPVNPVNSIDDGNTIDWFGVMTSGIVYSDEGTTSVGANVNVRLLINGVSAGTDLTDTNGRYQITAAVSIGDKLLVYVDEDDSNAATNGTTVTVSDSSNLYDLDIYYQHVMTRHDNSGSLSNLNMKDAKGAYVDTEILYSVDGSNNLTVSGANTELYIPAGYSYAPGANITSPHKKSLGTFNGAANAIDINGDLIIGGGDYTATSGNTNIYDDLTISGGVFTHNSGTFIFDNTSNSQTVNIGAAILNDVSISKSGSTNLTVTGTMDVDGDLTITNVNQFSSGTIAVAGNVLTTDSSVGGSGTILFDGAGAQLLSASGGTGSLSSVDINKSGGTLTIQDTINMTRHWTYTAGTVDAGTSTIRFNSTGVSQNVDSGSMAFNDVEIAKASVSVTVTGTMDVDGNLTISSVNNINTGTIAVSGNVTTTDSNVLGSGTILFDGTGAQLLSASGGTGSVPRVAINKSSGTLTIQDTINVTGHWTYTAGTVDASTSTIRLTHTGWSQTFDSGTMAFNDVEIIKAGVSLTVTGTMDIDGDLTITSINNISSGTITVAGNLTSTDANVNNTTSITLDGTGTQNIDTSGGDLPDGTFTINKTAGTTVLISDMTTAMDGASQDLTITQGTLDLNGFNLTVPDVMTVDANGTLQLEGGETLSTTTTTLNAGSTVLYDGAGSYTGLEVGNAYSNLTFNGTGTWTLDAPLDVNADLTITSGTFDVDNVGNHQINLAGNWSNSGTFNARNGLVVLDGGDQSINGSNTFYSLTKTESTNNAADVTLTFDNTATQTFNGTLTLDGLDADDRINLVSDSPGNHWDIVLSATATKSIDYVDVSWSDASGSDATKKPVNPSNSIDGGNTIDWFTYTTTIGDGVAPVSRDVWASGRFFGVSAFTMQTDSGTDNLTALTVTFSGSDVNDIMASGVMLWRDDGGTNDKWDSTDTYISTAAAFVGNDASFTGFSEPINTTSTQYIITYNIDSAAGVGNTLQGAVTAATVSNSLVNNDTVDATLTVEADIVHETSVYKISYSPGALEHLFLKGTSSPTTEVLTQLTVGSNFSDPGLMEMLHDPDTTVTTLIDNSAVKRLQMSGSLMDPEGDSYGPVTSIISFYEDRTVLDIDINITTDPPGTDWLFMSYGIWDDAILDETLWWSSNNSGSYNSQDPPPNNTGNQTAPISFQWLLELGATDGLVNGTLQNISNYGIAHLKHYDPDTGLVDIAYQKVNPGTGNKHAVVMYSFDTATSGYDTTITEERQDGFISPATLNFVIAGGDGSLDGDGYMEEQGVYTLNDGDADDHVRFQFEPTTTHHAPVFEITGWNSGAPGYIDVGGVLKTSGTHYNAAVTGTTLYLQYLSNISANTIIEIPSSCPGFVVTTTADTGMGSLRACIDLANSNPGADTITFNIAGCPGGLCTINPSTSLPTLNDATGGTTIDGYTQTGASANTVAAPGASDAVLNIEIDESGAAVFTGLTISSADNIIKGLIVGGFNNGSPGISITGASAIDNIISGNYLGTNNTGTAINANRYGVAIENGAQRNTVGGSDPADRNIISGNSEHGVSIDGTDTNLNVVAGNFIGTDVNGTGDLGNTLLGVSISGGAQSNTIGGNSDAERNIISGNNGGGIRIYNGNTDFNTIKGNFIGTDVNGTAVLENLSRGVLIDTGAQSNTIGGTAADAGNVISGNNASGIYITGAGTDDNIVQGNFIGTDLGGTMNLGNTTGIYVVSGPLNTIIGGISSGGNMIAYNASKGIRTHGGGSDQVFGNTIYNNSRSGISSTAPGVSFIKNTIRDNGTAGPTDDDGIFLNSGADNNLIYHNTVHANNGDGILLNDAGITGTIIKNNNITANGGWGINNTIAATITNDFNNVPASPTTQGNTSGSCTGCSLGSSSLSVDPLYNDEPGDDYTLTECTSPVINMACDLGAAGDDTFCDSSSDGAQPDMNGIALGNFNNNAPDMGAYETSDCDPGLTIVKQVWEDGGSNPLGNPTAPVGATLVFIIYVKNTTAGPVTDLRINDDLDEAGFEYVADSLRRTSDSAPPTDGDTDLTIFNKSGDGTSIALTDAVDVAPATEVSSAQDTAGPVTVDKITVGAVVGQTNASLSMGAHETFALRFKVKVK